MMGTADTHHLQVVEPQTRPEATSETVRQGNIEGLLESTEKPLIEVVREVHDRTALVIPTCEHPERRESIQHVLHGLGLQPTHNLDVYIGDNGISPDTRAIIEETAKTAGVSLKGIIDARAVSNDQKNPAYPRNRTVRHIIERGYDHPEERVDSFIFGDDDAVFSPDALPLLLETHQSRNDIAAVVPEVVPVRTIQQHLYTADQDARARGSVRQMPHLWTPDGEVEIMKIVGFSSDVTTKSCGLLVDAEALRRIHHQSDRDIFVRMPRKSGEDMILGATLSRMGRVMRNDEAKIYDKVRSNPLDTRKQRAAWGEDHVYMANDFQELGYLPGAGLRFLHADPRTGEWSEFCLENYDNPLYVINPQQIEEVLAIVKQRYAEEGAENFFRNYGVEVDQSRFEQALITLETILEQMVGETVSRKTLRKRRYDDIAPMDLEPQTNNPRFSVDALTGLLVGNLVANAKLNPNKPIFYGLRQALAKPE